VYFSKAKTKRREQQTLPRVVPGEPDHRYTHRWLRSVVHWYNERQRTPAENASKTA